MKVRIYVFNDFLSAAYEIWVARIIPQGNLNKLCEKAIKPLPLSCDGFGTPLIVAHAMVCSLTAVIYTFDKSHWFSPKFAQKHPQTEILKMHIWRYNINKLTKNAHIFW